MKIGTEIVHNNKKFKVVKIEAIFRYFSAELGTWKTATRFGLVEIVNSQLFKAQRDSIIVW